MREILQWLVPLPRLAPRLAVAVRGAAASGAPRGPGESVVARGGRQVRAVPAVAAGLPGPQSRQFAARCQPPSEVIAGIRAAELVESALAPAVAEVAMVLLKAGAAPALAVAGVAMVPWSVGPPLFA